MFINTLAMYQPREQIFSDTRELYVYASYRQYISEEIKRKHLLENFGERFRILEEIIIQILDTVYDLRKNKYQQ